MARTIQMSFSAGELSQRLYGRYDLEKYYQGASELLNMIVLPNGGIERRPGTRFVSNWNTSSRSGSGNQTVVLIPFEYSDTQTYVIEIGYYGSNKYMRIYRDGGAIQVTSNVASASWAGGEVTMTTVTPHHLTIGAVVTISGITPSGYNGTYTVTSVDVDAREFTYDLVGDPGAYTSDGEVVGDFFLDNSEFTGSWVLSELRWTQSADVLYICQPGVRPYELRRYSDTDWRLVAFDYRDGPYDAVNTTGTTLDPSAATGSVTIAAVSAVSAINVTNATWSNGIATITTASSHGRSIGNSVVVESVTPGGYNGTYTVVSRPSSTTLCYEKSSNPGAFSGAGTMAYVEGINNGVGFVSSDVGRLIRLGYSNVWGDADVPAYAKITAVTNKLTVTATVYGTLDAVTATTQWRLGAWSGTDGWPRYPAFHQGRLWFFGRNGVPQNIWSSVSNDFTNMQPSSADGTVADDDAITVTISDDEVNPIYWGASIDKGLAIGTGGGEFLVVASGSSDILTPSNVTIKRQSGHGSKDTVSPAKANDAILFPQANGEVVREFRYSFDRDQYAAINLSILAENILDSGIKRMAFAHEPYPILWCLLEDGTLAGMTYDRDEGVIAWHQHEIAGNSLGDALVYDICVIREDNYDQLWMVVLRKADGYPEDYPHREYIEYMSAPLGNGDPAEDACYADSAITLESLWNTDDSLGMQITASIDAGGGYGVGEYGQLVATGIGAPFDSEGEIFHLRLSNDTNFVAARAIVVRVDGPAIAKVQWLLNDVPSALQDTTTYDWSEAAISLTGLDHLDGETPGAWIDGCDRGFDESVSSGAIAADSYGATNATVGLYYPSRVSLLPTVIRSAGGLSSGLTAREHNLFAWFYRTGLPNIFPSPDQITPVHVGPKGGTLDPITFLPEDNIEPTDNDFLFTGTAEINVGTTFSKQGMVSIEASVPTMAPMSILSVTMEVDLGGV